MWTTLHLLFYEVKHFADNVNDLEERIFEWATLFKYVSKKLSLQQFFPLLEITITL